MPVVVSVELLRSWSYCRCGTRHVCVVARVELLLLLNYCRRGTTHALGRCMCGNVDVVEVLSSWK